MGGAVLLVAEVAVEVDVAGVEQGAGAIGEPGELGVGSFEFADAQPAVRVGGDLLGRQPGEEAVAVDGAEQPVGVVVALVAEAGRMEGDHAAAWGALGVALEGQPEGAELAGPGIVETATFTTLLLPGHRARLDGGGNMLVDVPV